jgi:hypothetical protein
MVPCHYWLSSGAGEAGRREARQTPRKWEAKFIGLFNASFANFVMSTIGPNAFMTVDRHQSGTRHLDG